MTVEEVIAIRTSSGTVKAGLKYFIRLFGKRTDLKEVLKISDEDIKALIVCEDIKALIVCEDIKALIVCEDVMGKIYREVNNAI